MPSIVRLVEISSVIFIVKEPAMQVGSRFIIESESMPAPLKVIALVMFVAVNVPEDRLMMSP